MQWLRADASTAGWGSSELIACQRSSGNTVPLRRSPPAQDDAQRWQADLLPLPSVGRLHLGRWHHQEVRRPRLRGGWQGDRVLCPFHRNCGAAPRIRVQNQHICEPYPRFFHGGRGSMSKYRSISCPENKVASSLPASSIWKVAWNARSNGTYA